MNTLSLDRPQAAARDDAGFVTVWTIFAASGIFLLLLGLVYDGGNVVNDRIAAHRAAEQAARAAADQITGLRSGTERIDVHAATRAATQVLGTSNWTGDVAIDGLDVTVTVRGRTPTVFLGAVGLDAFTVEEQGTASAVTGLEGSS